MLDNSKIMEGKSRKILNPEGFCVQFACKGLNVLAPILRIHKLEILANTL